MPHGVAAVKQGGPQRLDVGWSQPVEPHSRKGSSYQGNVSAIAPGRARPDRPEPLLAGRPVLEVVGHQSASGDGGPRTGHPPDRPGDADWLVTSHRVAGRLRPDILRWWEWAAVIGVRVDLAPGHEIVQLDFSGLHTPLSWAGPGIAPLAVAAIHHLYGPAALLEHPGLQALHPNRESVPAPVPFEAPKRDSLSGGSYGHL